MSDDHDADRFDAIGDRLVASQREGVGRLMESGDIRNQLLTELGEAEAETTEALAGIRRLSFVSIFLATMTLVLLGIFAFEFFRYAIVVKMD